MQKLQIIVSYDGTNYHGWQYQQKLPSIVSKLQTSFQRIFNSPIKITGASRTDAGVHAHGQVAVFETDLSIDLHRILIAWNNRISPDIVIRSISKTHAGFHPFYNVERKTYHYHIFVEQPSPFVQRFGFYCQKKLDMQKFTDVLNLFVGTHDFSAFCSADSQSPTKIRTVDSITLEYIPEWRAYRIVFIGASFLQHMIRRIVGAAVKVATTPALTVHYVQEILNSKNPNNPLPTAPAKGLTLHEVVYQSAFTMLRRDPSSHETCYDVINHDKV